MPGNCHALSADRDGQFAVHLWGQYRLIFEPNDEPIPRLEDGGIDRSGVTSVVITEVADYHGRVLSKTDPADLDPTPAITGNPTLPDPPWATS